MHFNWGGSLRVLSALCLIFLLAGCAVLPKDKIALTSTSYNLVVERAQNEMLLLNIIRASKRRPMYFTEFNALRGSMKYDFTTGSLTVPFGRIGGGLSGAYSIAPSIGYSTNPNFDLVVLNDQEFIQGIMTPVTKETVNFFFEQGWPRQMLLFLFVQDFKIKDKDKEFINNPGKVKDFTNFQTQLHKMSCRAEKVTNDPTVLQLEPSKLALDLKGLVEIQNTPGLSLKQSKSCRGVNYQLESSSSGYEIRCRDRDSLDIKKNYTIKIEATLRSPQAILNYLGEIVRADMDEKLTPEIFVKKCEDLKEGKERKECEKSNKCPLFSVRNSGFGGGHAPVIVDYDGARYMIKAGRSECTDRSMQVLTIISQLIGLQKKGKKAPVTGVVTFVGG